MCDQPKPDWFQELPQYEARLFGICYAKLQDRHLAEDAIQETYLAVIRNEAKYDPHRPLEAWLKGIAENKAFDLLRRLKVRNDKRVQLPENCDLAEVAREMQPSPVKIAIRAELEDLLNNCCLPKLTGAQQEALRLFFYEELSLKKVEAEMQKSKSAVGGLLRDAKKSLRAHIAAKHPEYENYIDWSVIDD